MELPRKLERYTDTAITQMLHLGEVKYETMDIREKLAFLNNQYWEIGRKVEESVYKQLYGPTASVFKDGKEMLLDGLGYLEYCQGDWLNVARKAPNPELHAELVYLTGFINNLPVFWKNMEELWCHTQKLHSEVETLLQLVGESESAGQIEELTKEVKTLKNICIDKDKEIQRLRATIPEKEKKLDSLIIRCESLLSSSNIVKKAKKSEKLLQKLPIIQEQQNGNIGERKNENSPQKVTNFQASPKPTPRKKATPEGFIGYLEEKRGRPMPLTQICEDLKIKPSSLLTYLKRAKGESPLIKETYIKNKVLLWGKRQDRYRQLPVPTTTNVEPVAGTLQSEENINDKV